MNRSAVAWLMWLVTVALNPKPLCGQRTTERTLDSALVLIGKSDRLSARAVVSRLSDVREGNAPLLSESQRARAEQFLGTAYARLNRTDSSLLWLTAAADTYESAIQNAQTSLARLQQETRNESAGASLERLILALRRARAFAVEQLGEQLAANGRSLAALAQLQWVERQYRADDNHVSLARVENRIGSLFMQLGTADSAQVYFVRALERARTFAGPADVATIAANLAQLGGLPTDQNIALTREAYRIRTAERDTVRAAMLAIRLSRAFLSVRVVDSARTYASRAGNMCRARRDMECEGQALYAIANSFVSRATDSAFKYYSLASRQLVSAGRVSDAAEALSSIALLFSGFQQLDSSEVYLKSALRMLPADSGWRVRLLIQGQLEPLYRSMGQPERADSARREESRILARYSRDSLTADNLYRLALVALDGGHRDSAIKLVGISVDRTKGTPDVHKSALADLGTIEYLAGLPNDAILTLRRARELVKTQASLIDQSILVLLGRAELARKHPSSAVAYFDTLAHSIDSTQESTASDLLRTSRTQFIAGMYEWWALTTLSLADSIGVDSAFARSLRVTERGRARSLLSLMRRTDDMPGRGTLRMDESGTRQAEQPIQPTSMLSFAVTRDTLLIWYRTPHGKLGLIRQPFSADSLWVLVARARARLGVDSATRSSQQLLRSLGDPSYDRDTLSGGIRRRTRCAAATCDAALAQLATLLLPPEILSDTGTLLLVTQGPLNVLPFAILPARADGTPLGVIRPLVYAPSVATYERAARTPGLQPHSDARARQLRSNVLFGDPAMPTGSVSPTAARLLPPLPAAREEALSIAAIVGGTAVLGDSATESRLKERAGDASLIHFATHGVAFSDASRTRSSFVALAPDARNDGQYSVGEVLDDPKVTFRAALVVLSACETGLGAQTDLEGTIGFQRAFLAKGARQVLVSLWRVSDEATKLLLLNFYRELLGADAPPPSRALLRAQATLRSNPAFANPRYWAAFQLVGPD